MADIPKGFIDTLILREEPRDTVYKDTSGHLTGGTGHKLTKEERKIYKEGDIIPKSVSNQWLKDDSLFAYEGAMKQAKSLGISDQKVINSLASVNFQLGRGWRRKFPDAWKSLQKGDYKGAVKNLMWADSSNYSDWYKETPDRVKDFARSLLIYDVSLKPEDKLINKMKEKDDILNYAD
jgi:hypothetical protein